MAGIAKVDEQAIAFKMNGLERIRELTPTEEKIHILRGTLSLDFRTLFEAVDDRPYPVKVVTSSEAEMTLMARPCAG